MTAFTPNARTNRMEWNHLRAAENYRRIETTAQVAHQQANNAHPIQYQTFQPSPPSQPHMVSTGGPAGSMDLTNAVALNCIVGGAMVGATPWCCTSYGCCSLACCTINAAVIAQASITGVFALIAGTIFCAHNCCE
jgi:hypothetical protein